MMNLLQQLGLGEIFPSNSDLQKQLQEQALQQQADRAPYRFCIHDPLCLICQENRTKREEENKKQEEVIVKKKKDYKNRCKIYMNKFRRLAR